MQKMQETQVWSLGWENPLEKEMETHSSIFAWKIPRTEESGGLQSIGSQRVGHDWATEHARIWPRYVILRQKWWGCTSEVTHVSQCSNLDSTMKAMESLWSSLCRVMTWSDLYFEKEWERIWKIFFRWQGLEQKHSERLLQRSQWEGWTPFLSQ